MRNIRRNNTVAFVKLPPHKTLDSIKHYFFAYHYIPSHQVFLIHLNFRKVGPKIFILDYVLPITIILRKTFSQGVKYDGILKLRVKLNVSQA